MRTRNRAEKSILLVVVMMIAGFLLLPGSASAQDKEPVTVHTFVRAESDIAFDKVYEGFGFNTWLHHRTPVALDKQTVIRMNRDTVYSSALLDLSKPAFVTLPDVDGRYMSLHVLSQDHYSFTESEPGRYEITREKVGSRYAFLIIRTFIDADDPEDIKAANQAQDALQIEGGGDGPFEIPNWNRDHILEIRGALNTLAKMGGNAAMAFGTPEEVEPIDHLVYAAAGWGGLPQKDAFYEIASVEKNDGTPHVLTVKDVPVGAFWSVTVYNADGFIEENDLGVYSYNNVTAKPNEDGSITIKFGDCGDGSGNCLPIAKGWNYAIRMYEPRQEILDGSWVFPSIEPVE